MRDPFYLLLNIVTAQAEAAPQPEGLKAVLLNIAPFILMATAFYFLMLRPMWKQNKNQQMFLKSLKKDDEVVTNAGLKGKIYALTEHVVTLEIAPGVRVQQLRSGIAGKWGNQTENTESSTASETKSA